MHFSECSSNPCQNGATCIGTVGFYQCSCAAGYTGVHCELTGDSSCSENYNLMAGGTINLYTPGYGSEYPNNVFCKWVIDTPEGVQMRLMFLTFNIERNYDFLSAGDGNNPVNDSTRVIHASGAEIPENFISDGNVIWITFMSDNERVAQGVAMEVIDEALAVGCVGRPCLHGSTCTETNNEAGYVCSCVAGRTGSNCENRTDSMTYVCENYVCDNGGTCFEMDNTAACQCPDGYAGLFCEIEVQPCDPNPCSNGGTCIEGLDGSSFTCSCSVGWSGSTCGNDVNVCETQPCLNGATCVDSVGSYFFCSCMQGFSGVRCEIDNSTAEQGISVQALLSRALV
ncbi:fibropellin-1-like [Anneissia japonica]|uniref:fibropellin-1-like n=1 Tax=Anneissia japonica TaxID=1529436 RepID=UPI001425AFC5|nr:fibropellin-1-like [Anneissia japonica]